jgi:methanogenic corrinoid protein MtbC1
VTVEVSPGSVAAAARRSYLEALLGADAVEAQRTVDDAIEAGTSVASVYLDVVTPALSELGVLWERAEIGIGDEHLATAITQGVLASLATRLPRAPARGSRPVAVLGSAAEDFHAVGARMVGDFLVAAGWRVLDLGASTPAAAFAEVAADHRATVVAVSTSRAEHLDAVREVRAALDRVARPPRLAVGGLAYHGHPERAAAVGADLHAADPRAFVRLLARSGPA